MRFQERQKTKTHSEEGSKEATRKSVRYLGYSRMSGLQPGGGVVVTFSFSDTVESHFWAPPVLTPSPEYKPIRLLTNILFRI